MEIIWIAVKGYIIAFLAIAVFVVSLMKMLDRIPPIAKNKHFIAWKPLVPALIGGLLGELLIPLYPAATEPVIRVFVGLIAGMNAGIIFAVARRYARMRTAKALGEPIADSIFAPVDENGQTLPPTGEISAPKIAVVKKA